ncbi:MAG: hypothetical protein IT364_02945 [Candidatus Hydrogenedentes bacterium]|nr:hypothetical protein [Candidatus Hydrogenedentota bacterium]
MTVHFTPRLTQMDRELSVLRVTTASLAIDSHVLMDRIHAQLNLLVDMLAERVGKGDEYEVAMLKAQIRDAMKVQKRAAALSVEWRAISERCGY